MRKIILLSFPANGKELGLDPSILSVAPQGDNVVYSPSNRRFNDAEVEKYLCSVYIGGFQEFKDWTKNHDIRKIIVGGYHPTMFPEKFLNYAWKIIMGPCDDLVETLAQRGVFFQKGYFKEELKGNSRFVSGRIIRNQKSKDGQVRVFGEISSRDGVELPTEDSDLLHDIILPGVLTFKNPPRYDLYDIELNKQVLPGQNPTSLSGSVNSSFGCPFFCDFCCTPVMFGPKLISRPVSSLERDAKLIKERFSVADPSKSKDWYMFIRDENFTLQKDYAERLRLLSAIGAKIYLFASANTLKEDIVRVLAENNVFMVCLGLEDPTKSYGKNKRLYEATQLLKKYGIYTYLSFIVNPVEVRSAELGAAFYGKLREALDNLLPEMICGNFLMPFPGTPMWDEYYWMISESDFQHYDSKTPFLVKNEVMREKMKYYMFKVQWDYYTSNMYRDKVRTFESDDTLYLRFLELKAQFDESIEGVKMIRP